MRVVPRVITAIRTPCLGIVALGLMVLGMASCTSSHYPVRRTGADLDPGWPRGHQPWHETTSVVVPAGLTAEEPSAREALRVPLPELPDAMTLEMDDFCQTCHEVYSTAFADNVHGEQGCESCHGGASLHLESRGLEPNTIFSFRTPEIGTTAGRLLSPAEQSEACLKCHENGEAEQTAPCVTGWRTSAHAHGQIACSDCHRTHYNVPSTLR